jgi:hypothetical protein
MPADPASIPDQKPEPDPFFNSSAERWNPVLFLLLARNPPPSGHESDGA